MVQFGQVVLGPPGSGKTTYCKAMCQLLEGLGRKVGIINIDPANDELPYTAEVDINELVNVQEVMETQNVGPNGALVFCMELLEKNTEWLHQRMVKLKDHYLIFDFPGQAELYSHHNMIRNILEFIQKLDVRLCSVYMVDAHYANDPGKYISAVLLSLNSMLQMEVATVNVLSKVDTVEKYGKLDFGLDFYTEVLDLDYIVESLDVGPITKKYFALNKAIADVITDYSLVSFIPLAVDNRSTVMAVMKAVDKANGYVYGAFEERNIQRLLSCAVGAELEHESVGYLRDQYCSTAEDEEERIIHMLASQNEQVS